MKTLTLADLKIANDIKIESVPVPEWGGQVHVRTLTALEHACLESEITDSKGELINDQLREKVIAATLCDENGVPFFADASGVSILGGKSTVIVRRLYEVAAKLNGLRRGDTDEKKPDSGNSQTVSSQ